MPGSNSSYDSGNFPNWSGVCYAGQYKKIV